MGKAKKGGSSNPDLEKNLRNAIIANDAQRMQMLFDGISTEESLRAKLLEDNGLTLLFFALDKCAEDKADVKVVQCLLQNGVKAGQANKKGALPLPHAIANKGINNISVLQCLLKNGANPNESSKNGSPPLFCAVYVNCGIDVFELLLNKEENLNALLAHVLDKKVNIDVLKFLLEKNSADLAELSNDHKSQLLCTLLKDEDHNVVNEVRKVLIAGASLNKPDKDGIPPLHRALTRGRFNITQQLLDSGANSNQTDGNGQPPLHHALIVNADIAVIKLLLNSRADPTVQNQDVHNALQVAVLCGRCDAVEILLNNAELKKSINSVLPLAVGKGDIQMIKLLLGGVDPNQLSEDDKSRLSHHFSPQHEDVSIKKKLPKNKVKHTAAQQKCGIKRNIKAGVYLLSSAALCLAAYAAYKMIAPLLVHNMTNLTPKDLFDAVKIYSQGLKDGVIRFTNEIKDTDEIGSALVEYIRRAVGVVLADVKMYEHDAEVICGLLIKNGEYDAIICIEEKDRILYSALCIAKKDEILSDMVCATQKQASSLMNCLSNDSEGEGILLELAKATRDRILQLGSVPNTIIQDANVENASNSLAGNCSIL